MQTDTSHTPRDVPQVMLSSTFTDLQEHRKAIIKAVMEHELHPKVMEYSGARLTGDVVDSSLQMVRESAAYILIISRKYGQTPKCEERNPDKLSITELEFNEAQRLGRPALLFIMGENHPVTEKDIELVALKRKKLNAFRERAKKASQSSDVNRVYAEFNSLAEFKDRFAASLMELAQHLASPSDDTSKDDAQTASGPRQGTIPTPPALYAEPDYIGSHQFVGRVRELEDLSEWARLADPTNLLLYEAIGGNGKSMLTWEWTTRHAEQLRTGDDAWAGRFWYSFYERGAIMADFCRRALAYMTGQPMQELRKKKTAELAGPLLQQPHARPWLLILDGLERVLVAYHRIDAAEMPDEDANNPTDKIVNRNPCDAIRDGDNDLFRALAAARPSKLLVSSRLTPRVPVPGMRLRCICRGDQGTIGRIAWSPCGRFIACLPKTRPSASGTSLAYYETRHSIFLKGSQWRKRRQLEDAPKRRLQFEGRKGEFRQRQEIGVSFCLGQDFRRTSIR